MVFVFQLGQASFSSISKTMLVFLLRIYMFMMQIVLFGWFICLALLIYQGLKFGMFQVVIFYRYFHMVWVIFIFVSLEECLNPVKLVILLKPDAAFIILHSCWPP